MAVTLRKNTRTRTLARSNYGLKHKRITPEELVKLPFHMCLPLGKSSPLIYSLKMVGTSAPPHVLNEYFCAAQTILEIHGVDAIGYCDSKGKTALSWAIYGIQVMADRERIPNTLVAMGIVDRLSRIAHKIITLTSTIDDTSSEMSIVGDPSCTPFLRALICYYNSVKKGVIFPTIQLQGILYHMFNKAVRYEWSEHDLGMNCVCNDVVAYPLLRVNRDFERMSRVIIGNTYRSWD
jgi:hypothetical protein